jgi:RNA polymerase sigma factor (sigma-70 family)
VAATRAGDDRAFERLYQRYQRRIAAYVHGMVKDHGRAEDITQEVFISALRRMRETERPIIFKPWIYEIAKNACIDAFRRSRRAEEISYDADGGLGPADHGKLVSQGPTPDAAVDTRMSLDHLRGAFGGLSETHHDILVMRELEGLSYREIGQRLGMSRPSVESTLFRARRRLTEEYEELTSGERCASVQTLIAETDGRRMGVRQERQLARHVSHCQPCRRAAFAAGLDVAALADRKSLRSKIAALLPIPAFLRRWFGGDGDGGDGHAGGGALARWSTTASQYAEPASGWAKAATVAAVAVAGVGAGVGVTHGTSKPPAAGQAPAAAVSNGSSGAGSAASSQAPGAATGSRAAGTSVAAAARGTSSTRTGAAGRGSGTTTRDGSGARGSDPAAGAGGGSAGGGGTKAAGGSTGGRTGGAVGGTADKATGAVNTVTDGVRKTVDGTKTTVSTTTKSATDTVKDTVRDTTDKVDSATNNATKPVSGAVNGAVKTVGGAVQGATGTVGGAIPSDPVGTVTNSVPRVPTPSVSVPTPSVPAPSVPDPPPVSVPRVSVSVPTPPPVSVPTPTLPIGPGG